MNIEKAKKSYWNMLLARKSDISAVLPRHLTAERMLRLALIAANNQPKILECEPASVIQAVVSASSLGLSIGGQFGSEAYLVPYGRQCQLIVSYRGMISLARRSGQISTIEAHCVYENDGFEYSLGLNPKLQHSPHRGQDRGELVAVYAIARFREEGVYQLEVMWRHEVDQIRKLSRSGNSGPWKDHFDEMARKTVVRRLAKYLPLSADMVRAIEFEDTGHDERIQLEDVPPPSLPEPRTRTQSLADKLASRRNGTSAPESSGTDNEQPEAQCASPDDLAKIKSALNGLGLTDRQAGTKIRETAERFGFSRDDVSLSQGKTTIPMETLEAMVEAIEEEINGEQPQA